MSAAACAGSILTVVHVCLCVCVLQDDLMDAAEVKDMLDVAGHVKVSSGRDSQEAVVAAGEACMTRASARFNADMHCLSPPLFLLPLLHR